MRLQGRTRDDAALSARLVADQLGHARPSMTQDVYMGRRAVGSQAAQALEAALTADRATPHPGSESQSRLW